MKSKKMLLITLGLASVLFANTASACVITDFIHKLFGVKGPTATVQTPVQR